MRGTINESYEPSKPETWRHLTELYDETAYPPRLVWRWDQQSIEPLAYRVGSVVMPPEGALDFYINRVEERDTEGFRTHRVAYGVAVYNSPWAGMQRKYKINPGPITWGSKRNR